MCCIISSTCDNQNNELKNFNLYIIYEIIIYEMLFVLILFAKFDKFDV